MQHSPPDAAGEFRRAGWRRQRLQDLAARKRGGRTLFLGLGLPAASAASDAPRTEYFTGFEVSDNYASGYVGGGYAFGKAGLYEKGWRLRAVGAYGRYDYEGTLLVDGVYVPTTFDGQDA